MAATVIRNFIAKALFKKKGAIANNKSVDFSANALEQRLKNLGIDPNAIRSEQELNQILSYVKQAEDQAFQQRFGDMLGGSKFDRKGEVFDLTGKKINPSKGIMGGKEINEQTLKEGLMKTDNPFSDLVKTTEQGPKTLKQREAEVLARLEKENKAAAQRIRDRKRLEDRAIEDFVDDAGGVNPDDPRGIDDFIPDPEEMAQGGRAGFADGTPELKLYPRASGMQSEQEVGPGIKITERDLNYGITGLLEGDKFFGGAELDKGKVKIDVVNPEGDTLFKDTIGKEDAVNFILGIGDPKGEKFQIKTDKDFENMQVVLRKSFANGGRIGLKAGMTKRAFLKLMGTGAAGIAALKSGILGLGKGAGKQVAEEVVKKSTSTPPAYFFELANKIKTLGRVSDGPAERIKIHSMPAKDGKSELMLTEDIGTGEMQIKKIGKEGDEMVTEVQTMDYTPGSSQADEATQGIPADSYDEYTEFNSRIIKDEYNDPDIIDGIKVDEIIEEVKDQAPSIKKAGGGIARMLGE